MLDHRRVCRGCVWVDEYLVKWVGYGLLRPPGNPLPIWPMLPLPWLIFWPLGEGHAWGHASPKGGVMLGFDV